MGLIDSKSTIVAPRGEFSEGALSLKRSKKFAYIAAGKRLGLFENLIWHASTEFEASDIRRVMGATAKDIMIASDLSGIPRESPSTYRSRCPGDPLRIAFISRISPMKNLTYALRILGRLDLPIVFNIFGPPEDAEYTAECERLSYGLPTNIVVRWRGSLEPSQVSVAMVEHDLFFLPTLGENYGHVIAEALAAGTPVLISDLTPWRGLSKLDVGDDLPLADPLAFVGAIRRANKMSPSENLARRQRAFDYARERHRNVTDVEANRRLFGAA